MPDRLLGSPTGAILVLWVAVLGIACVKAAWGSAPELVVTQDGAAVSIHGELWRPIDDSAVFYYDASQTIGCPLPDPGIDLKEALERHGFHGVVRCRLVDFVDCAGTSSGFRESGGSRVLKLSGDTYRVTAPAGKLGWFSYDLAASPKPGRPHLVVCQLINDRERHTTVTLDHADNTSWAAPYAGEENYVPRNQEGATWRRDVGVTVYTGREYHCDGKPYTFAVLFYPKTERATVTISHYSCEMGFDELNGAAVARIWMFDVLDPLPEAVQNGETGFNSDSRKLALYVPHPWFLYSHFGIPPRRAEWRERSLREMVRYLKFCGFNQIQLHIINGSDRAGSAWYDSKLYNNLEGDLFKELLPIAESEGIEVVPIVTPLTSPFGGKPSEVPTEPDEHGWSRDSCLLDKDGEDYTRAFGGPVPNPLRPEVQDWQIACFKEILDRCAESPAVPAVGFRVNGKIGLCFTGDLWHRCGQDSGYNDWMVEEFTRDTGIEVPLLKPTSYAYIREHCWDEWLQWRCARTREFWIRCRDFIRSYRPNLKFLAACDLPSETPGYNLEWPSGEHTIRDLYRHHGYDPDLFVADDGIWIQRGMMVAGDRYWFDSWFPYEKNAYAHKMFNYAPGVAQSYRVPDSSGVELYHNYWEESPHPHPQYGPYMRTATPVAYKDFFYEPAVFSIRKVNVDRIAFMGWQRACAGHEHDIRRFARAFRSIPKADPREFDGKIETLENGPQVGPNDLPEGYRKPEHDVLWAAWFGDRLAVINDAFCSRRVRLSLARPALKGERLVEHGSGRTLYTATADGSVEVTLDLRPFDLQVFSVTDAPQPEQPLAPAPGKTIDLHFDSVPALVVAGDEGEFGVVLVNGSSTGIRDVVLNVRMPRGWSEKSGDARALRTLAAGARHSFRVRATADVSAVGSTGHIEAVVSYLGPGGAGRVDASALAWAEHPVGVAQDIPVFFGAAGETVEASVEVANRSARPVAGGLSLSLPAGWTSRVGDRMELEPGEVIRAALQVVLPQNATPRKYAAEASFIGEKLSSRSAPLVIDIALRCPRVNAGHAVDADLREWQSLAAVVDAGLFRTAADTGIGAVAALEPRAWFAWDDDCLYVAVRTADTQFSNPFPDSEMWKGDSLQLGLDLHRSMSGPRGFFEFGFTAAEDGGTRVRVFRTPHGKENVSADPSGFGVNTGRSGTAYEAALKWSDLGFDPQPGDVIGIAMIINDYDGSKRRVVTFADGLADDKDPTKFTGLRLEP